MARKKQFSRRQEGFEYEEDEFVLHRTEKFVGKKKIRKTVATPNAAASRFHKIEVVPRTENQKIFHELLKEKTITIGVGCAGTGKTFLAVYAAVRALAAGEVDSIVVTRAMTTVGKAIGHLPGTEQEKLMPYVAPMIEYLTEFLGKEEVAKMIKANIIRVIPIALLRGYTFKNAYIILDEAQNTTPMEFKTILTRIGEGSRMAILGDMQQSDIDRPGFTNGLREFIEKLDRHQELNPDADIDIGGVEFDLDDIQRSKIVREILEVYETE